MAEQQPISKEEGNWPEFVTDRAGDDDQSNGFSAPPPVADINVPLTEGIEEIIAPLPPALLDLDIAPVIGAQSTFVPSVLSQDDTMLLSNTMNEQNLLTVDSTQSFNLSPSQFSPENPTDGAGNSLSLSLSQDNYQLQGDAAGTTPLTSDLLSYPNSQSSQTMSDPLMWTRQTEDLSTALSPTISSQYTPASTTALRNQEQSPPSISNPTLLNIASNVNPPPPPPPPESIPVFSIPTPSVPIATNSSIVISSLDPSVTDQEIIEHISNASVTNVKGIYRNSPNVCTVMFHDTADAFSAAVLLNGLEMKGASVQVTLNDSCSPSPSNNYVNQRFDMSKELYQCFGNDAMEDIKRFEGNGGLLTYSSGFLYIEAPSHALIDSFKTNTIAKYTERSIVLTEMQWEELMMNDAKNYIELVRPFETNSHIIILPIRDDACKLLMVGTLIAVESAYTYCWNILAKDIRIERVKLEALKAFHPSLSNDIFIQYQVDLNYTSGGIALDGLPHNIPLARADVEKKLSELIKSVLPPFKPILFLSFKRKLSSLNPKIGIIFSDGATEYICCRSEESLQEIMKMIRKKKNKEINLSGQEALERVRSKLLTVIQQIEQDFLVDISIKTKNSSIVIHGYVTADLSDAKERIQTLLKSSEVVRRPLEAPPGIALYVHHCIFKQQTEGTKQLLTGLTSKVTSSEDVVYLEGTSDVVSENEKKILEHFATSELECKEFPFSVDCRFISHIESEVLRQLHKKKTFTHVITRHDKEDSAQQSGRSSRQGRCHSSPSEGSSKGFTISIYSASTEDFQHVCSEMETLSPRTESITVSPKSTDYIMKRKQEFEKAHTVRIFLVGTSTQSPKVLLHGIRDSDILECRAQIEDSLFVTKKIEVTGYQVVYLKTKCHDKLEELQGKCHTILLPQARVEAYQFSKKFTISVIGKSSAVDGVLDELKEFLCDFAVSKFAVTTRPNVIVQWKKRWLQVKKELESEYEIMLEFYEKIEEREGDERRGGRGRGRPKAPGRPNEVTKSRPSTASSTEISVNFTVYGLSKESVENASSIIKTRENGDSLKRQIPIKDNYRLPAHIVELANTLDIASSVWLQVQGKNLMVIGLCSAPEVVDSAVEKITSHLEGSSEETVSLQYNDEFISAVMTIKAKIVLKEASEAAVREQVKISLNYSNKPCVIFRLTGLTESVQIVKKLVEDAIEAILEGKSTKTIDVDYYKAPYFKTEEFKKFSEQVKAQYSIIITTSNRVVISKELKPTPSSHSLQVSIVSGDLLNENVDAIVNAANVDLKHIGGLAKKILDKGGDAIQAESNNYVALHGPLLPGTAVCLGPGKLPFKNVIHAVAPRWVGGLSNEQATLEQAVLNVCLEANNNGLTSVSIPALGTGVFSVPGPICASASIAGLIKFCKTVRSSSLRSVHFVLLPNLVAHFEMALKAHNPQPILPQPILPQAVPIQSPSLMQGQQLVWSWRDDDNVFKPYDQYTNRLLSQRYQQNPLAPCQITVRGTIYEVDFQNMMQENTRTNFTRKIKLTQSIDEVEVADDGEEIDGSSGGAVKWCYYNDQQQWALYDDQSSSQLESWYQNNSPTGQLLIGKHSYAFDFDNMQQKNVATGNVRAMKRLCSSDDDNDNGDSGAVKWSFNNDKGEYQEYAEEHAQQLEEWYQSGTRGRLRIGKFIYSFDFENMTQCNTKTNTTRSIKRQGPDAPASKAAVSKVPVTLCGPREHIDKAASVLQSKLDKCLFNDTLKISSSSKQLERSLHNIACRHSIKLDIISSSASARSARLVGVTHLVKEALTDMQKCLLTHMETASQGMTVQKPKEWEPQQKTMEIFVVREGTKEYQHVVSQFQRTMPNVTVHCIERIQNQYLWEKYSSHKASLQKKNAGQVNEKELFHGTRTNDPKQIYDSEEGFDMRFSASGMWGQANYFAVNASYSDNYAHTGTKGARQVKQMFLAKVLTGVTYQCASDSKLRMPPEKPSFVPATSASNNFQLSQVRYDTVSGNTHGSDVFMTYDNLKAYPAYLISYGCHRSLFGY